MSLFFLSILVLTAFVTGERALLLIPWCLYTLLYFYWLESFNENFGLLLEKDCSITECNSISYLSNSGFYCKFKYIKHNLVNNSVY